LIQRPGLIRIGFDDLLATLRSQNGRCLFGFGESDSDNRAHDALKQALKNPLMDKGRMLADAANVLVQVAGGPDMTLSEVEILMQELGRHVRDHTQILFGTAVDGGMGNRLSVTIISSIATQEEMAQQISVAPSEPFLAPPPPILQQPEELPPPEVDIAAGSPADSSPAEPEPMPTEPTAVSENLIPFEEPTPAEVQPPKHQIKKTAAAPRLIVPKKKPLPAKETEPPAETTERRVSAKQEVLQFEPLTRGRFEKSEPTIVEGQDLDVPTFLRKNIRVK
jgi:cell division protein FtsZ